MSVSPTKKIPTITKRFGGTGGAMIDRNKKAPTHLIKRAHQISERKPIITDPAVWKKVTSAISESPQPELLVSGGSAANTAYMVSTLIDGLQNNASLGLPAPSWFQGTSADDKEGRKFSEDLKESNIENRVFTDKTDGAHSGGVLVTVDDKTGERSMFTSLGVSNNLKPLDKSTNPFKDTAIYQAENYTLHDNVSLYQNAFKETHKAGGKTLISLSNAFLTHKNKDIISNFIQAKDGSKVDVIAGNEEEIASLVSGKENAKFSNDVLLQKAQDFAKKTKTELVVTLGEDGSAIIGNDGEITRSEAVTGVKAKDTTGAGDSYLGGFIAGQLAGLNAKDPADIGASASAIVVAHEGGPRPPQKDFTKTIALLRQKIEKNRAVSQKTLKA